MDFKNWEKVIINQIVYNKDLGTKNLIGEISRSPEMLVIGVNFEHSIFWYEGLEKILEPAMRFLIYFSELLLQLIEMN